MQIRLQELLDNISGDAAAVIDVPEPAGGGEPAPAEPAAAEPAAADPPTAADPPAEDSPAADPPAEDFPAADSPAEDSPPETSEERQRELRGPDEPMVAASCPPTPRRTMEIEALEEMIVRDAVPPPIPAEPAASSTPPQNPEEEEELEPQHFSAALLSPFQRRKSQQMSAISQVLTPPLERVETSALIDVQSMAAAYLRRAPAPEPAAPVPIPISNDQSSPILLPRQIETSGPNPLVWVLVALSALFLIAASAATTAFVIKRSDRMPPNLAALSPAELAAFCAADGDGAREASSSEVPPIVLHADSSSPAPAAASLDAHAVTEPDSEDLRPDPARDRSRDLDRTSDRDRSGDRDRATSTAGSPAASGSIARVPLTPPSPSPSSSTPSTAPSTSSTTSTSSKPSSPASSDLTTAAGIGSKSSGSDPCDEVTCLVSGKGCCGKAAGSGSGPAGGSQPSGPDPNLPARPTKQQISSGVAALQGRLQSCGDLHGIRGAVSVKLQIAPAGKAKATTTAGEPAFQACVEKAFGAAKFPATQEGARVTYPVVLK